MEIFNHFRLSYPADEAAKLLGGIGKPKLNELVEEHQLHTYRVGRKLFIPAFEIDRLIGELLRLETYRQFKVKRHDGV